MRYAVSSTSTPRRDAKRSVAQTVKVAVRKSLDRIMRASPNTPIRLCSVLLHRITGVPLRCLVVELGGRKAVLLLTPVCRLEKSL
jgi:hypothetical protein